jgi:MoaA/NifB/PqqE/SkfB family radical SAM enzyme
LTFALAISTMSISSKIIIKKIIVREQLLFSHLTFEISGICNARCPYCVTGSKINPIPNEKERFLSPEHTASILDHLLVNNIISNGAGIELYNWGEPFLNPQLNNILYEITKRGFKFDLSTNGSIYQKIQPELFANLNRFTFSFPGFSQDSYNRIHGFSFENIKSNVSLLTQDAFSENPTCKLVLAFLIYQFNISEMADAQIWAKQNKLEVLEHVAYLNGYELSRRYKKKEVPRSGDLILGYEDKIARQFPPESYRCPQFDMLTLDQNGKVVLCCVMDMGNPDFYFKDVRDCNLEEIKKWKESRKVCKDCLEMGIAQWNHNSVMLNTIFEDELVSLNAQIKLLSSQEGKLHDLEKIIVQYESLLQKDQFNVDKIETSISWRITEPLRYIGKKFRIN